MILEYGLKKLDSVSQVYCEEMIFYTWLVGGATDHY